MVSLHRDLLLTPTQSALKALQIRCLGSVAAEDETFRESLDPVVRPLLETCQVLRKNTFKDKDIVYLARNELLADYVEHVSTQLTDESLLVLSLLTWHFGSSLSQVPTPSRELLQFFLEPSAEFNKVCKVLRDQYNERSGKRTRQEVFNREFGKLLRLLEHGFDNIWVSI
ncbi:hypothetical protein BBP40_003092 [Aspergillus hancockii]|nr:hypothetical protein BBP40_003092 [Aspergillus hancockii]